MGLWEYIFFVDIEGHHLDSNVKAALAEIEQRASFVKVLGSYPVTYTCEQHFHLARVS